MPCTALTAHAGAEATIEREHILRLNASGSHWQPAAESAGGAPRAEHQCAGGAAVFDGIFLSSESDPGTSPV